MRVAAGQAAPKLWMLASGLAVENRPGVGTEDHYGGGHQGQLSPRLDTTAPGVRRHAWSRPKSRRRYRPRLGPGDCRSRVVHGGLGLRPPL